MTDQSITDHIEELVAEEQKLFDKGSDRNAADKKRLEEVEVELDRYWDLLRQRRAKEEAGEDPDEADLRDADTVENYE